MRVLSCETLVWRGLRSQRVFSEQSHSERSLHAARKTRHLVGLRFVIVMLSYSCYKEPIEYELRIGVCVMRTE